MVDAILEFILTWPIATVLLIIGSLLGVTLTVGLQRKRKCGL